MSVISGEHTNQRGMEDSIEAIDLHELAKGWKAAIGRVTDPSNRHEARIRNDRGNLPLHTAASFRAPIEVTEALLDEYPEAASVTNNYGNLALHFTAWKKGPLDVERLLLKVFPEGAAQKNNHGNLPLHYAAHYNAPLDVVEALYKAFPDGANEKNNDSNTPLDLAIADGASSNVVALLQGKSIPASDDEYFDSAKARCEQVEKEFQRNMEGSDDVQEDLEGILNLLMDIKKNHPHALYSAGMDSNKITNMDSLLAQVRASDEEEKSKIEINDESQLNNTNFGNHGSMYDTDDDTQMIEDTIVPPDDEVELLLSTIVGNEALKNQVRGLRRSLEIQSSTHGRSKDDMPRHMVLVGKSGTGKTIVGKVLASIMYKIGVVRSPTITEAGRKEFIDRKSEARTVMKTRRVLDAARGGVLFLDEAYSLLPNAARPRSSDHGAAALRELGNSLNSNNGPLIIMAGDASDLQSILISEVGFKGNFLTRFELAEPSPQEIARMFFSELIQRGFVPGDGLNIQYVSQLLINHTDEEWRAERNGRIANLLFLACRNEIKARSLGRDDQTIHSVSTRKLLPPPGSTKILNMPPEEIVITAEDVQNVIMSGL